MIKNSILYLKSLLEDTGLFSKVYDLCELITIGNKTYPAWYDGSEFKDISNFDLNDGTAYFRKSGDISIGVTSAEFQTTSCNNNLFDVNIPLKVICVIKKSKADCEDAFAADEFAEIITTILNGASGVDNVISANCVVKSYSTKGREILKQEYSDPSINEFNLKFAYMSFDIEMKLSLDSTCLKQPCYNG